MKDYAVIVTDTSPLITLAKADELGVLLRLGVTVRIPDIVYLEATGEGHEDGALIAIWARDNDDLVRITPTSRVVEWQTLKDAGMRPRDYGEIAAIEVVTTYAERQPDTGMLLIYEDADMNQFSVRAAVDMATTGTFLGALEEAGLIQSADRILDLAAQAGRNVDRQRDQPVDKRVAARIRSTRDHGGGSAER